MKLVCMIIFLAGAVSLRAQKTTLPYATIPDYPENFTAGAVAARLADGLGFRFYWATEGLREEDLAYRPNPEARTSAETIEHIYEMSVVIVNATTKTVNASTDDQHLSFSEMRKRTLENLKAASERLRVSSDAEMKEFKIMFKRDETITEIPFWNAINGPIADCLWHVGQIVSFRRSSGNPFSGKVDVFSGTVRK